MNSALATPWIPQLVAIELFAYLLSPLPCQSSRDIHFRTMQILCANTSLRSCRRNGILQAFTLSSLRRMWRAHYENILTLWDGSSSTISVLSYEIMLTYFIRRGERLVSNKTYIPDIHIVIRLRMKRFMNYQHHQHLRQLQLSTLSRSWQETTNRWWWEISKSVALRVFRHWNNEYNVYLVSCYMQAILRR